MWVYVCVLVSSFVEGSLFLDLIPQNKKIKEGGGAQMFDT